MTETIDRTLPEAMIELARLALASDIDEVALGFDGLDGEFEAPIGWDIHLFREIDSVKPAPGRDHLSISCRIGEEPSAFVLADQDYWNPEQIREWIQASPVRSMTSTDSEKAAKATESERMIAAWKLGWSASRKLSWDEKLTFERNYPQLGELPLSVSHTFGSINWFYNTEGHEAHRDTGAEVSYDIRALREGLDGEWIYVSDGAETREDGERYIRHISIEDAHARITEAPPWFARVAYSNDELEGWVL